ncbi:MAG: hypothetical protein AB1755_02520 [Candidatus Omnitrophota bacterium]
MRQILKVISIICVVLIFCIGMLFFTEIAFRLFINKVPTGYLIDTELFTYQQYVVSSFPPDLILGKTKNVLESYFSKDECVDLGGAKARFNSYGFRSPEFKNLPPKKKNEFRIIITGGSVATSWAVGESCTLDKQLYERLKLRHPEVNFKIFNLAGAAWISFQELIAIQLFGINIDPDLVIALDGFNDIQHAYHMPINLSYSNGHIVNAFNRYKDWISAGPQQLFRDLKFIAYLKSFLTTRKYRKPSQTSDQSKRPKYPKTAFKPEPGKLASELQSLPVDLNVIKARTDFDPYNRQAVENYLKNITCMARSLDSIDSTLIVALQPTLFLKNPLSEQEKINLYKYYEPEVNFCVQGYIRMIEGLEKLSRKEKNVIFCDLSRVFEGDNSTLIGDNVHTHKVGYGIIAERLTNVISDYISSK